MTKKNDELSRLEQSQAAKKLSLAEWRSGRIHERILPSGLTVKLRDVSMTDLMLTGKLPNAIIDMAKNTAESGGKEFDLQVMSKNSFEFSQMLDMLVELSLIEPCIGTEADNDHILLAELPADDKMDIFTFMNREAGTIKSFREG